MSLTRIQAQVFSFIKQARSSGVEKNWIKLISGHKLVPGELQELDALLSDVLKSSPSPAKRSPNLPYAFTKNDNLTRENLLYYEIPRSYRLELQKKSLAEKSGNVEEAKLLYRKHVNEARSRLLRDYALRTKLHVIPPIDVKEFNEFIRAQPKQKAVSNVNSFEQKQEESIEHAIQNLNQLSKIVDPFYAPEEFKGYCTDFRVCIGELVDALKNPTTLLKYQHSLSLPDFVLNSKGKFSVNPDFDAVSNHSPAGQILVDHVKAKYLVHRKAFFPVEVPPQFSLLDLPPFRLMVASLFKMEEVKKKLGEQQQEKRKRMASFLDQLRASFLYRSHMTYDGFMERYPEFQVELEKRLLNDEYDVAPPPEFSDR